METSGEYKIDMKFSNIKEKTKIWIKDPYNITFLLLLAVTILYRLRYLFQESIWVDETAYMLAGHDFAKWPIDMIILKFNDLHFIPEIIIAILSFIFSIFIAGRIMALLYAILGLIFIYLIGKEMKNEIAGLIAAILISFNPEMWFYSSRTLIDSPLTTMFIICTYFFIKYLKQNSTKNLIILVSVIIVSTFTKYVGGLFIFIIALTYILKLILNPKSIKKLTTIPTAFIIGCLLAISISFLKKYILWGIHSIQYNNFFLKQMPYMLSWPIIILSIIGIIISLLYKKDEYITITSWALVVYGAFTFLPAGPYTRYILPALPSIALLASVGLTESINLIKQSLKIKNNYLKIIAGIILLLIIIPIYYKDANSLILNRSYPFSGYDEAGEWIKKNVEIGSKVYVMSTSWAALFSGYDGFSTKSDKSITFKNTAEFKEPTQLINHINNYENAYLIIDNWEAGAQPTWLTPTNENINNLINMGFELVHIINKKYPINQENFNEVYDKIGIFTLKIDDRNLPEIPVIFIFKKIKND